MNDYQLQCIMAAILMTRDASYYTPDEACAQARQLCFRIEEMINYDNQTNPQRSSADSHPDQTTG